MRDQAAKTTLTCDKHMKRLHRTRGEQMVVRLAHFEVKMDYR